MITEITKTPQGNTGVTPAQEGRFNCCVDWFQGTFNTKYLNKIVKLVETALGFGKFERSDRGIRFFDKSLRHPSGAVIGIGRKSFSDKGFGSLTKKVYSDLGYLEMSGSVLAFLSQARLRKLLRFLRKKCKYKCTRIDIAIDDMFKKLNLNSIKRAADNHHYTGFGNTPQWYEKGRKGRKGKGITFGKRGKAGGGKYMEFYDKSAESDGRIDAIRIELAAYKHYAIEIFEDLTDAPLDSWGDIIFGWINGSIDFRKRKDENDKDPGRRPRLRWWEKVMKEAVNIKPAVFRPPSCFQDVSDWLFHQVAPSLAMQFVGRSKTGEDFLDFILQLIKDGESRLQDRHHWMITKYVAGCR